MSINDRIDRPHKRIAFIVMWAAIAVMLFALLQNNVDWLPTAIWSGAVAVVAAIGAFAYERTAGRFVNWIRFGK